MFDVNCVSCAIVGSKTSLKLATARIKLLKNKKDVQVKQMRRDLAQLLETGQDQTARIRVSATETLFGIIIHTCLVFNS